MKHSTILYTLVLGLMACATPSNRTKSGAEPGSKAQEFEKAIAAFRADLDIIRTPPVRLKYTELQRVGRTIANLKQLLNKQPKHKNADEARKLFVDVSPVTLTQAAELASMEGFWDQMTRDQELKESYESKFGLTTMPALQGLLKGIDDKALLYLLDKEVSGKWKTQGISAKDEKEAKRKWDRKNTSPWFGEGRNLMSSLPRDYRRFPDVLRKFASAYREFAEPSAYGPLASAYAEAAQQLLEGKPVTTGFLKPQPMRQTKRRKSNKKIKRKRNETALQFYRRKKAAKKAQNGRGAPVAAKPTAVRNASIMRLRKAITQWMKADYLTEGASDEARKVAVQAHTIVGQLLLAEQNTQTQTPAGFLKARAVIDYLAKGLEGEAELKRQHQRKSSAQSNAMASRLRVRCSTLKAGEQQEACKKRASTWAAHQNGIFLLPLASPEWVKEQRQQLAAACAKAISLRSGKDIKQLIEASLFIDNCRPLHAKDFMAINEQLTARAKPLRRGVERQIKTLLGKKLFFDAKQTAKTASGLYGNKWHTSWNTRITNAAKAQEKRDERKRAKAKKKRVAKCMRAMSGRFLCDGSPRLICGKRCGHHRLCPCCTLTKAGRRRACGG